MASAEFKRKREAERQRMIRETIRVVLEMEQIFLDVDHWNRANPHEQPIDPDPEGEMRRAIDRALAVRAALTEAP